MSSPMRSKTRDAHARQVQNGRESASLPLHKRPQ